MWTSWRAVFRRLGALGRTGELAHLIRVVLGAPNMYWGWLNAPNPAPVAYKQLIWRGGTQKRVLGVVLGGEDELLVESSFRLVLQDARRVEGDDLVVLKSNKEVSVGRVEMRFRWD